jgi:hypothetical protein
MPHAGKTSIVRLASGCERENTKKKRATGADMQSRKHLRTVLFVAIMLAIGAALGAALLIERQGGSQVFGKQESSGAVGRTAHAPMVTSGVYGQASERQEEEAGSSGMRWNAPGFVSWPQGATGGAGAYGWVADYEWPEYYGHQTRGAYSGAAYTFVGAGPDNTAAGRVSFNRGSESAPATGSLFSAVPASLSSASANPGDVGPGTRSITPPVPEPAEWTMLIVGLLLIGALARRRNRQETTP